MVPVAENLSRVRSEMAEACRRSGRSMEDVRLIAVTKKQPEDRVRSAYEAGQRDFGENYVQELERRRARFPRDALWHMIGHLQTNKVKRALAAALIHALDSERLARALSSAVIEESPGAKVAALVEVNIGLEPTKSGVRPEDVEGLIDSARVLPGLEILGLMCVPPPDQGRRSFAALRDLRDRVRSRTGLLLRELSMGMSGDYVDAIAEGATMVRVGTAIFGDRGV